MRTTVLVVKFHHPLLAALVMSTIPGSALLHQNILATIVVGATGLAGVLLARRSLVVGASLALLFLLVLGKTATNIFKLSSPDTAVLLAEFTAILVLMEASTVILAFSEEYAKLQTKSDDLSQVLKQRLEAWLRNQLSKQTRLSLVALGLSLGLLPVAGFTSVASNELTLSATLALLAVVVLMFLVIYRREPKTT